MKRIIITGIALTMIAFLLPLLLLRGEAPVAEEVPPPPSVVPVPSYEELSAGKILQVELGEETVAMDISQYLWGVVAAEMPASFEQQALHAQAVAARTYALKKMEKVSSRHPQADICGDYRCCQAYISYEKARENWGGSGDMYTEKISRAVAETGREVALYDGALIDAVFHSSSAGGTLDSVEVWGGSLPYLVSVESPEGTEVPNYNSEKSVSADNFRKTIQTISPTAQLEGSPSTWSIVVTQSSNGGVDSVLLGGAEVSGQTLRSLFGLRSTHFAMTATQDSIIFAVTGYGHGVGMSQYGANTMAKEGKTYREILTWYYSGVTVEDCPAELWAD